MSEKDLPYVGSDASQVRGRILPKADLGAFRLRDGRAVAARVALPAGFQARPDADPANSRQHEIDTEEKPENIEARNRPVRKDDKAESERDYAGQDHPDPRRPLLHA